MFYFKMFCEEITFVARKPDPPDNLIDFYKIASDVRPFVFHDLIDLIDDNAKIQTNWALPFKNCSFEFHGKSHPLFGNSLKCLILNEVSPEHIVIWTFGEGKEPGSYGLTVINPDDSNYSKYLTLLSILVGVFERECRGMEKTSQWVRLSDKKGKKYKHWIRKVVHVCKRAKRESLEATKSITIDWSHRWEVRGHWRSLQGLGKDRSGEYCVPGKTWVLNHVKGPDDRPLIKKVRVVNQQTMGVTNG